MGRLSPRPPLGPNATAEEIRREIAQCRRQIRRDIAVQLLVAAFGAPLLLIIAVATVLLRATR